MAKTSERAIPNTTGGAIAALHMAGELMAYEENFSIENQLAFANLLAGETKRASYNGIFEEEQFERLKADIQLGKPKTYLDFFSYSYCAKEVVVPQDITPRQVLNLLAPTLNQIIFNSFIIRDINIEEEEFHGHPTYHNRQVILTLNTGARWHKHTYICGCNTLNGAISNRELVENVLLFINEILAEFAARYRFTAITNQLNPQLYPEVDHRYMLCRLGMQQTSITDFYMLQKHALFNQPYLMIRDVLPYRQIEYIVYHFKACGLLDHLSEHVIDEIISGLQENTYINADQLLAAFPDTMAVVDNYTKQNQPPFLQILGKLGFISKGILNFTDVADGTPTIEAIDHHETYQVSFNCNGVWHSINCEYAYGELYEGVIFYLTNEIIRKNHPELALLHLAPNGVNQYAYTVIDQKQLKYLIQAKITLGSMRY